MPSKPGPLPDEPTFPGQECGDFAAYELVADRFLAVGIQFIGVRHLPGPRGRAVVISHSLLRGGVFGFLCIEGIAVLVLHTTRLARATGGIDLENRIIWSINIGVNTETEDMLVVVCVN